MDNKIYHTIQQRKKHGIKSLALLVDPCKMNDRHTVSLAEHATGARVDYLLVEGSASVSDYYDQCIQLLKQHCNIPVMLFPGHSAEGNRQAGNLLCLSLINGQEEISTGYMVIGKGASNIPPGKYHKAVSAAIAGETLGMQLIFMNIAGGAGRPISVPGQMVTSVVANISVPLLVGGGIDHPEKAHENCRAGADVIIAGNAIGRNNSLIAEMAAAVHVA